jgi:23S rRNA (pseudouridine1915-N3)-methyltransferase
MKFHLRAIGTARGEIALLQDEYLKRLGKLASLTAHAAPKTMSGKTLQEHEAAWLLRDLPRLPLIVMDETGKDESSEAFATRLQGWANQGGAVFLLGGADGHLAATRARADHLMSLGRKTWPHMLARILLLEQIYRARQIWDNHPYHRG